MQTVLKGEGPARTGNDNDYERGVGIPMKPPDNKHGKGLSESWPAASGCASSRMGAQVFRHAHDR